MTARRFGILRSLGVALLLSACFHPASDTTKRTAGPAGPPVEFRRDPPVVLGLWVTPLVAPGPDGNADVLVRFAGDPRLPAELPIDAGGPQPMRLRRRGGPAGTRQDGTIDYEARATLDLDGLQSHLARLREARAAGLIAPGFFERRLVVEDALKEASTEPLRAGVQTRLHLVVAPRTVRWDRVLFMTDETVVRDATRTLDPCTAVRGSSLPAWSFGRVMQAVAATAGTDASSLVRNWLDLFDREQPVKSDRVPSRPAVRPLLLDRWQQESGGEGKQLDLALAPFRLQAIVNRIDLHENPVFGGRGAEGRFIFGGMDLRAGCSPLRFSVIVEFAVGVQGCQLADWALRWRRLDDPSLDADPEAYRRALEDVTTAFARPGADVVIRTTERIGSQSDSYEMREFRVAGGRLVQSTVRQTPRADMPESLRRYLVAEEPAILADTHVMPETLSDGTPLLAGAARMESSTFFWPRPGVGSPLARRKLSLATCNGCHAAETATDFFHIDPRFNPWNTYAQSAFLRVLLPLDDPDPAGHAALPPFDERRHRTTALNRLADGPCLLHIEHRPLHALH